MKNSFAVDLQQLSALVHQDSSSKIISLFSDNSGFLYEYNITDTNLKYHSPTKPESKHSKKDKPDFESLTHFKTRSISLARATAKEMR
jgi:hypothetical protein